MALIELDAAERRLVRAALAHHLPAAVFADLRETADRIIGRTVIADVEEDTAAGADGQRRTIDVRIDPIEYDETYELVNEPGAVGIVRAGAGWPDPRPRVGVTGEPPHEEELER